MENHFNLSVFQVMNITDIDDKIIHKAKEVFWFKIKSKQTVNLLLSNRKMWLSEKLQKLMN